MVLNVDTPTVLTAPGRAVFFHPKILPGICYTVMFVARN